MRTPQLDNSPIAVSNRCGFFLDFAVDARLERRFEYLCPANWHYAARPQKALDAVLDPPSR